MEGLREQWGTEGLGRRLVCGGRCGCTIVHELVRSQAQLGTTSGCREKRFGKQSQAVQDCVDDPSLQHQGELGGSAATCTGRRPIDSGRGCRFGFWGALVTMRVRGASENMRGGQGHAARQKMQEQRFLISTSACGRSFSIRQGICRSHE